MIRYRSWCDVCRNTTRSVGRWPAIFRSAATPRSDGNDDGRGPRAGAPTARYGKTVNTDGQTHTRSAAILRQRSHSPPEHDPRSSYLRLIPVQSRPRGPRTTAPASACLRCQEAAAAPLELAHTPAPRRSRTPTNGRLRHLQHGRLVTDTGFASSPAPILPVPGRLNVGTPATLPTLRLLIYIAYRLSSASSGAGPPRSEGQPRYRHVDIGLRPRKSFGAARPF